MSKLIFPFAAAVDISAKEHVACVPDMNNEYGEVRKFGSYTRDLHQIAEWFREHKIETVVMESTGIYFLELYSVLGDYGFDVVLVHAAHAKNVPGRPKTDVKDAQWLQKLHSFGLLRGCFQPDNQLRTLRSLVRLRSRIINDMTTTTNRIVKCLEMMNIKTKMVIKDIHGKTGKAVVKAIVGGERNAENFLKYKDRRIKASNEDFVLALEGNWKEEQLYILEREYELHEYLQKSQEKLDLKIESTLEQMLPTKKKVENVKVLKTKTKNSPSFNAKYYFINLLGVDPTEIYGIKETGALKILSETGIDLKAKYPTEKQFVSWLNLVPDTKISGGKLLSQKMRRKKNRAGQAFREAANSLWRSKNPLGDKLRSKKAKKGAGPAIISIAKKLAAIYYTMVTQQREFDPQKLVKENSTLLLKRMLYFEKKAKEARKKCEMIMAD